MYIEGLITKLSQPLAQGVESEFGDCMAHDTNKVKLLDYVTHSHRCECTGMGWVPGKGV